MTKFKLVNVEKKGIDLENGIVPFVLTERVVDRDSEVIEPAGVQLDNYMKNPVFLWAHDLKFPPIGKIKTETIKKTKQRLKADVQFDLNDPFAAMVFQKYANGFLNAGSIRFMPITVSDKPVLEGQRRSTYKEWELLEFSAVPVPANPNALVQKDVEELDDERVKSWLEELREFAENDNFDHTPEGWVQMKQLTEEAEDSNTSDDGPAEDKAADDEPVITEQVQKSSLPPVITAIKGSFEWITQRLAAAGKEFLQSNQVRVQPSDKIFVISTFKDSALLFVMGADRPFSEDQIFRASYQVNDDGVPEWTGQPKEVTLRAAIEEKSIGDLVKRVIPFHSYPLADEGMRWDANAATGRLRRWASSDGSGSKDKMNWSKYARAFAFVDASQAQSFGGYKLPHHDIVNGQIQTVWRGVAAAMVALLGGRGGVNVPAGDRRGIYNHLKKHYQEFDKEAPDFKNYDLDDQELSEADIEKIMPMLINEIVNEILGENNDG